jgi:HAD superfamily hydrolase (TIGR01509 family)
VITTVAFDADDTLVDIRHAVASGLAAVSARTGVASAEFAADASAYWRATPELAAREIRIASLRHTLARHGLADRLEEMTDVFFQTRYANSRPFPGAVAMLTSLRACGLVLGYATNANSRTHLCGLGGLFDFEIYALENGVPKKPHPDFFHAVLAAASARPEEVVYVGDSYDHDVVGAAGAGIRGIWLNRAGTPTPGPVEPAAVIADLSALPGVLDVSGLKGRLSLTGEPETV